MRAVVQRVSSARVTVDTRVTGEIGTGLLVLVGVEQGDGPADVAYVASKIRDLRIFEDDGDEQGRKRMNRSVMDVGGRVRRHHRLPRRPRLLEEPVAAQRDHERVGIA